MRQILCGSEPVPLASAKLRSPLGGPPSPSVPCEHASPDERGPQKWLGSQKEQASSGTRAVGCRDNTQVFPRGAEHSCTLLHYIFSTWGITFTRDNRIASFSDRVTGEGRGECGGRDFPSVCSCRDPGVVRTGSGEGRGNGLGASWTFHCPPLKELWLGQMADGISLTDVLDISAVIISSSGYLSPRQLSY